ncbi:MAG: class I SAM-dependent methyltransferase [Hormoscilla sp.]
MQEFRNSIDWERECVRLTNPTLTYPEYYTSQNFHGIKGGYLTVDAAVTYDPVTQYALPPNETWVRESLLDAIICQPRRILDLGCGTGSTSIMLKQAYPQAEVIGLDLSPQMLLVAELKAKKAGLQITWRHGKAEETGFPDRAFDLVTASLLFHETPPAVTKAILREAFRLLSTGGQMLVGDGNQKNLRAAQWMPEIFSEPYIKTYIAGNLDAWMGAAGFEAVETQEVWWLHQVTSGAKPQVDSEAAMNYTVNDRGVPAPAAL